MKETFSLSSGAVLTFNSGNHQYRVSIDGSKPVHVPSVTSILGILNKPSLIPWAVRCACDYVENNLRALVDGDSFSVQQVFDVIEKARTAHDVAREEAAEIGTNVHDWLRDHWRGLHPPMPEEARTQNCIRAALDWFQQHDLKPVSIEEPLYSKEFHICGRPDWIGQVDGELCVLDYKSTRSIYAELPLQMSAYQRMYFENSGNLPVANWGLRLDKESGDFEARKYTDTEQDFDSFLACLKIYDRMKHLRRKPKPEPKEDLLAEL